MKINNNIIFQTYGSGTESALNINNPIVYSANSRISSLQYCGDIKLIKSSVTIDADITEKLTRLNAKVSLGFFENKYKNAHIYSKNAEYLDGRERICYLQQKGNHLVVSEFHGNRGAKYSALFRELALRLQRNGFEYEDKKFRIARDELDKFIDITNELIDDRLNEKLTLEIADKDNIDAITIKRNIYYYFKVYWRKLSANEKSESEVSEDNKEAVPQYTALNKEVKDVADFIISCDDISGLEKLKKLLNNRIQSLKLIKSLS